VNQTGVLLALKLRLFRNALRSVRREPVFKTIVIGLFIALWICGAFTLMYRGITFIAGFPGVGDYVIGKLLYLFTLALVVMLIASNTVLAYPVLYARRENTLLFSLPLSPASIMSCKLWETLFLSSWAFLLMALPLVLAYFLAAGMGVGLFFISWLFFMPLASLCGACGALISLLGGRYMPRVRMGRGKMAMLLLCLGAACIIWGTWGSTSPGGDQTLRFVNRIVARCQFASWFLLPSSWVVDGIFAVAQGRYGEAAFRWLVLLSNALFLSSLCTLLGEKLLVAGWDRRSSREAPRPALGISSFLAGCSPVRGMVIKDIITFCRDASQWGQFALFFGLLGIYVVNIRNLPYDLGTLFWRYLLFILNFSALGFTLAGLSSRFFFPLVSIELMRFWFLGLSPLGVRRILGEKYGICVVFTVGITGLLALLSGVMLRVSPLLLASSCASVALMGIAMSGLSVGLGAVYPNLRASSSAEIVSGLGGTMVLVLNMVYICGALFIQGLPLYLHLKGFVSAGSLPLWVGGGVAAMGALSIGTAVLSLDVGRRRCENMDL